MSTTDTYNEGWQAGTAAANQFIGAHSLRQECNERDRKRKAWNSTPGVPVSDYDQGYRDAYMARLVDHIAVTRSVMAGPPAR